MIREKKQAFKVGLLIFGSITILISVIYLIGSKNNLFKSKTKIYCVFSDIKGILEGNQVRFSGINVGTVQDINITSDSTVVLTLDIAKKYTQHIHKGFFVEINQDGLMGGKIISIRNNGTNILPVENGDTLQTIKGIDIDNMLNTSNNILVNTNDLVKTLNQLVHKFNEGDGDFSRLLNQNYLTNQLTKTLSELNSSLANISQISAKINQGKGDLGTLINDKKLTNQVNELLVKLNKTGDKANKTISELQKTATNINSENSSVNQIIKSPDFAKKLDSTITNINVSLEQFNKTANAIEESWILNVFSKKKKNKDTEEEND